MCFDFFKAPKAPDHPAPSPIPEPPDIPQAAQEFGLQAFRRRAALAGRKQTIKTSPLGIMGQPMTAGKQLLGA